MNVFKKKIKTITMKNNDEDEQNYDEKDKEDEDEENKENEKEEDDKDEKDSNSTPNNLIILINIEYKNKKCMIFFLVYYPIFAIYCSVILSFYLDIKYIIIRLSFIFAEILSLGIYINIFKKYRLLFFGISSSILSLIVLILFSLLLIKSLLPIVYVSIFWLITNAYFILWQFLSDLLCKLDEFFYSVIIFNYSIFLGYTKILAY